MQRLLANPHKAAALAYGVLPVLATAIPFAAGLAPATRQAALGQLLVRAAFVLVFSVLLWRGWWLLSALLVVSNLWRASNFVSVGLRSEPVAFINVALMAVIVWLLARSAWTGFSAWRARRLVEEEA